MFPGAEGLTDESGVTDHGVRLGHRIRTRWDGSKWAFSIDDEPFQAGDWKDRRATVIAAIDCIQSRLLDATL